jgi:translocation and assembly module TamB
MPEDDIHAASTADAPPLSRPRSKWRVVRGFLIAAVVLAALVIGLGVGARFAIRTDQGRSMVVRLLDGTKLGAIGKLHIEGLSGDPLGRFGVRAVSIVDARGPWLEARDIEIAWSPLELLARRVHIRHVQAGLVRVLRQPILSKEPTHPAGKRPVSVFLGEVKLRLETAPVLSVQRGLWDLSGGGELRRDGRMHVTLAATSLLHAGDGVLLALRVGRGERFYLRADATEAGGGALAGALGLPSDQALRIHAVGDGVAALGHTSLRLASGSTTPLDAVADWGKAGAAVRGQVSLAASRLTKVLAESLGPEARVDLTARQAKGELYAVSGALQARDGSIRIAGPLDWAKRRTPGLDVAISVSDLSKLLRFPKIGAAAIKGALSGDTANFTLKGQVQGEKLDVFGYGLSRFAGPATLALKDHEWRVQADLRGASGGGKGVLATLIGPAPGVQFDLSLLKTGHFLFRTLNVVGAGLKVAAQGGQGLFGDLDFKGTAQVSNLAPLHAGSKGQLSGAWTASEGRGAKAWSFTFDGKGSNFGSGFADLDHFLGPTPTLTAKGVYGASGLSITAAKLVGAALQVAGEGDLDPNQGLAADLDWSAKGPIVAGPLEIAGAAKGTGKITGTLSAPRADLTAELASLDLGQLVVTPAHLILSVLEDSGGVSGVADISGPTTKYGPANAKAAFRLVGGGLDLSDIVADAGGVKLSGGLALRSGEPSSADLTLAAGPGAFLASGRLNGRVQITDQPGGAAATIGLDGVGVSSIGAPTTFRHFSLHAKGPLKELPFQVAVDSVEPVAWNFSGTGVLDHAPGTNGVSLQGAGRVRKVDFKFLQPAVFKLGGLDQGVQIKVAVAGGQALIDAHQLGDALNAKASLSNVGLSAFSDDFTGTVSGNLALQGRGAHLDGSLDAALSGARSRDAPANEGLTATLKAKLDAARLHIDAVAANAEGLKSNGSIDLPVEASSAPFRIAIDRTKPVQGSFSADGEVRPLWDLFAGGERTLTGHLTTSGEVHGSLNEFKATGQGALTSGKLHDGTTGLALQNLDVDTTFGDNAVVVRRFSGADARGGTVSGEGRVSFAEDGASTFTLNLKRFQLIDNDIGRATASGAITVTHPAKGQGKLSGKLIIDRADIVAATPTPTGVVPMDVVEIHQVLKEGQEKPQPRALGPPILLDVSINADRGVYVKGKGLNVELSLDSHVGGTLAQPNLTGEARVVGGSYDFAGKRFDVDTSGLVRLGTTPSQIRLNLSARWEDPTLTAVVRVQGTAAKPEITLSSTPVLPQDEVLSRVLFGVSASQLAPGQSAELASALASLTGGGGFDIIGNLRQFAGLDRLVLGGTTTGQTTISGGKYINKDLYLEVTGGGRNGSGAQLEWRIRHNLSLVTRYGAALDPRYSNDSDASLSIRFRKDF